MCDKCPVTEREIIAVFKANKIPLRYVHSRYVVDMVIKEHHKLVNKGKQS